MSSQHNKHICTTWLIWSCWGFFHLFAPLLRVLVIKLTSRKPLLSLCHFWSQLPLTSNSNNYAFVRHKLCSRLIIAFRMDIAPLPPGPGFMWSCPSFQQGSKHSEVFRLTQWPLKVRLKRKITNNVRSTRSEVQIASVNYFCVDRQFCFAFLCCWA